jgi:CheY-like chemotaxis protein
VNDDHSRRGRSRWSRTLEGRFSSPGPAGDERDFRDRPARAPCGSEAILVVEDQDQVREAARSILERLGYRVATARTADEAAAFVRDGGEVDLLLTDVVLPGMNGVALADRILADRAHARVLFMSAFTSEAGVPEGCVRGRPCSFLEKPFSLDVLARAVRELLDRAA